MSVQSILTRGRRLAQQLMTDRCEIVRAGESVTDPDTGVVTPQHTIVYDGVCKIQTAGGVASENLEGSATEAIGTVLPQWSLYLHLPWGTTGIASGDVAEIVESADPNLISRRYRLLNLQSEKTHATAMRWNVREDSTSDGNAGV